VTAFGKFQSSFAIASGHKNGMTGCAGNLRGGRDGVTAFFNFSFSFAKLPPFAGSWTHFSGFGGSANCGAARFWEMRAYRDLAIYYPRRG
jgi:hypothetical protein